MKVLSVVGARPQFVKLGPIAQALSSAGHEHVVVHTGQHYDSRMSDVFFEDLKIPPPTVNLGVGSASHGVQTGAILSALEGVLLEHAPDWVLVYGDTNSTIAGALGAVKLHLPLAHLEAGLRSFNRRMPEEHNRVLTDHAADLCLAPTERALDRLVFEGLQERSLLVGDVMTDVCLAVAAEVREQGRALPAEVSGDFILATIHRAENTDDPSRLRSILDGISKLPWPVLLAAHPRLVAKASEFGIELGGDRVRVVEPLGYASMVNATMAARAVVTDSGGLQKESFLLRTPCTTVRNETEWPETVELGWNVLATNLEELGTLVRRERPVDTHATPFGEGAAAEAVVDALETRGRPR